MRASVGIKPLFERSQERQKEIPMLRMTLMSSALVALFALTACEQRDQSAQNSGSSTPSSTDTAMNEKAPADTSSGQYGGQAGPMRTGGIPLDQVQNPEQTLSNAAVKDSKGEAIGEVKSVSMSSDGKVQGVNVGIGSRTVALKADNLTYMQAENSIVTTQSKDEIQKMK
jgi:hypothetical protein